jgi:dolichyl-diphosphooligosaccharide--protein glycosyltransferase
VAILLSAFGIAFAIRSIWAYPVVAQWGALYTYGGGSDSYYHSRVMEYIIANRHNLIFDPMLNFPVGAINPREPLFDWMNAVLGLIFSPFFGGNAVSAGAWFLDLQAPLWSALGVFPVYLIGREVADRRTGLIAAMIYPFLTGNIDSSIFGYANYLSFYTFIILVVVYSYIRTVKAAGSRRWVTDYRQPSQYLPALRAFLRTELSAVKWAVFTGVSLGALALAWQGYTYAVVVIAISLVVAMVIERVRRVDSFGLYVATAIIGLVGFPMAMPYYIVQRQFTTWFDLPLLLFFGVLALLLPFLLMRDIPWVFSVPFLVLVVAGGVGLLYLVNPTAYASLVTGQGYFVKNLIYSTVAEAQAPSIDQLVLAFGVVTFFLAFVGLAISVYLLVHGRFKRHHIVFLVFALLSLYLPVSAAKFFLVASPIFALLPAEVIRRILDVAGYGQLRRTTASLSDRRSQFSAFRKAFKPRHVLVMALVLAVVLPNVWVAIDAGIPGNTKSEYSSQVAATLPTWLQLNTTNPSSYYFGAAGGTLDTPNQYDSAGYNWLAQQDTNLPPQERPAFVSWWDYGFQAIDQGGHPSVADNFQHGIDPAGQFLLSQNESQAIGVLITTLLQTEQKSTKLPYLPVSLNQILASDGLDVRALHNLLVNTSADYSLVVAHPERYLPVNPSTLTNDNAMYLATEYFLATSLPLSGVVKVYDDVQAYTGWTIRYAMTDSRLFPFTGTDTGIFYAPADLTGRVIDQTGQPSTFFNLTVLGSDGNYYPYGKMPAGVTQVGQPVIDYHAPFYDSMIYHIYIGYNGTQIGQSAGIPGLTMNSTLEPGWMLQHFQIVYKTAYLCTKPGFTGTCVAANEPAAVAQAPRLNGSADTRPFSYFGGGETMLEYYPGQTLLGTVDLSSGAPVGGARVTVFDGWGIPHQSVLTGPDGSFSIVLPPGNDTLNITTGTLQGLSQQGSTVLKSVKIVVPNAIGLSLEAPSLVQTFFVGSGSVQGFVYWQNTNATAYNPAQDALIPGAQVVFWGPNLTRQTAVTDASGSFRIPAVAPGQYNYAVLVGGRNYTQSPVSVGPGAATNASAGIRSGTVGGTVYYGGGLPANGAVVTLAGPNGTISSNTTVYLGTYRLGGTGAGNYTVSADLPGTSLHSAGVPVQFLSGTTNLSVNLTLLPAGRASYALTVNGVPAAGVPVRFTPVATFTNASASPLGVLENTSKNATVIVSSASGFVTAALPVGSYSVYAYGMVKGLWYVGVATTTITAGQSTPPVGLSLTPALSLSGTVAKAGAGGAASQTAVVAFSSAGRVVTWGSGGTYSLALPAGTYSLLALEGSASPGATAWADLQGVTLTAPSTVSFVPVLAERAAFTVGAPLAGGGLSPAAGATVTVSAGPRGPAVSAAADTAGSVALYVPSTLPLSAGSYCLSTATFGFAPTNQCDLSPSALANLSSIATTLNPVPVTVTVQGLPSGTSVVVNLTAESASAVNRSVSGGPTFSLSLPPGTYGVSARAVIGAGTVVYLPSGSFSTTLPVGGTSSQVTIRMVPQVNSTGTLSLPAGLAAASVNVLLSSPSLSTRVNGSAFENGFWAAPGTYSAYVTARLHATTYATLVRVSIDSSGKVTPTIVLAAAGPTLSGTLTDSQGNTVKLNTSVTMVGPGGATAATFAANGTFSLALDPSTTYAVFANGTALTVGPNGSYDTSWRSVPGASCTTGTANSQCPVSLVGTPQRVWLNGTLVASGVTGPAPGTLRLIGPYPSTTATLLSAPNGTFSVPLMPGAYSLYAAGTGSAQTLAALTSVLALPSASLSPVSVNLAATWTDSISVLPPSGGSIGPVSVTVTDTLGTQVTIANVVPNSPVALALPLGSYTVRASAVGTLGGVVTNASASATVQIVSGNVGTVLPLAFVTTAKVTGTLVGPSSATVTAGSSVTFAFSIRNTGNVPVTVHPVGTPSYWNFSFSFTNVTLTPGPSGSVVSGEVRVVVPAGTPVAHPGLAIEFADANGTILGSVTPSPTVTVVGYYGVAAGAPTTPAPSVAAASASLPFYVDNTGNQGETVVVAVADSVRLAGLGWSSGISSSTTSPMHPSPYSQGLAQGGNITLYVNLTAMSSIFVPPGSVTVTVSVLNASGSLSQTVTLSVPVVSVRAGPTPGSPPVSVTGPSLGPAPNLPPIWLVPLLSFVPAIALVVGVLTYRWWRTRRWTHR